MRAVNENEDIEKDDQGDKDKRQNRENIDI